jgi:hypothetical protein
MVNKILTGIIVSIFLIILVSANINTTIDSSAKLDKIQQTNDLAIDVQSNYPDAVTSQDINFDTGLVKNTTQLMTVLRNKTVQTNVIRLIDGKNVTVKVNITTLQYVKQNITVQTKVYQNVTQYTIDYNKLIISIYDTIKDILNRLDDHESRISRLESENLDLKKQLCLVNKEYKFCEGLI